MSDTSEAAPDRARASILCLVAGLLMILEGVGASLLSLAFIAFAGPLSALASLAVWCGGAIRWSGAVLAGFITGNQKAAAILVLVIGAALALFGFTVMVLIACGGGVNCPSRMELHVYALPTAFAAFNAMCAVLLWSLRARA
ncbi:MAG: hypothetical protein ABMA14_05555 [Hyphomonadaceae bacterium]